ncbi:isocitrate lyase/PEP mutase family protein [Shimazuella kribbensis]|uniref:isocitrate lyase/PEP mutase family protein n=1 Tax=Shimazuella kribbensis TaxID=139808 RepID=UPI0003F779AC|nr:isocitrate lyase/phosphoenolpyruvate mutase family protein [Shimazuella kribbensis]
MDSKNQISKIIEFRALHSNSFVLPNAWDAISAKVFEECGFKAIGTTSAGIAVSQGYSDRNMPFQTAITSIERIVHSVNIPVSVDIEDGYGQTIEETIETVRQVISTGAVGINIEDSTIDPEQPLYDISVQQQKISAIKNLADTLGIPLFINARTDVYWSQIGEPSTRMQETIKRALAYQEAGADCIFVPGVTDRKMIQNLRKAVSIPINLLAGPDMPSLSELSDIGIQRISCGSAPFRATTTLLKNIGEEIINHGTFHQMTSNVLSYQEVSKYTPPKFSLWGE